MNSFEKFLLNRKNLIDLYNKGDLSKEEFIEENYNCIINLGIQPFKKIDHIKKAIYNYQYYNALAKYYQKKAHELPKNHPAREDFFEQVNYFYSKKDDTTFKLLKVIDYINVEAYYVKTKSPLLKKKLIEIVVHDEEDVILHTINESLLTVLKYENVFVDEIKQSLIDNYINKKY